MSERGGMQIAEIAGPVELSGVHPPLGFASQIHGSHRIVSGNRFVIGDHDRNAARAIVVRMPRVGEMQDHDVHPPIRSQGTADNPFHATALFECRTIVVQVIDGRLDEQQVGQTFVQHIGR